MKMLGEELWVMGEERDEEGKKDEGGFGMKSGIMRLETMGMGGETWFI